MPSVFFGTLKVSPTNIEFGFPGLQDDVWMLKLPWQYGEPVNYVGLGYIRAGIDRLAHMLETSLYACFLVEDRGRIRVVPFGPEREYFLPLLVNIKDKRTWTSSTNQPASGEALVS